MRIHHASFVLPLLLGSVLAQGEASPPVTPQQFLSQEHVKTAYTATNNDLQPADALQLMLQCTPPVSTPYDSDNDGRNDTLKVYGFALVSAQVYQVRGATALAPAIQKAQLRANGAAAEFFGGLRTVVNRGLDSRSTTASVVDGTDLKLSDLSVETVRDSVDTSAQALLRNGRVTGYRLVSLGSQGLCVVARYELPLDQRAGSDLPTGAPAQGGLPARQGAPAAPGFPLPAPGKTGDF